MPKPHRGAIFFLILLFAFLWAVPAASETNGPSIFGFAEELFEQGDYFRAITEYKRFIYFYPNDARSERALFRIAESYFRVGRWEEAVVAIDAFIDKYPKSSLIDSSLYLKAGAQKNLKRFDESLNSFGQVIARGNQPFKDQAIYQSALIHVERNEWAKAKSVFSAMPKSSPLYPAAQTFSAGLDGINDIPRKSPALAGTLAAVLPGAGHVYTDRYRDALIAFLLNGAFIWSAIELFQKDEYVTAGIVTFFEIGWYSGNIYSAVSSAHKYNERSKGEYLKELQEKSAVAVAVSPDGGKYLKVSFSF